MQPVQLRVTIRCFHANSQSYIPENLQDGITLHGYNNWAYSVPAAVECYCNWSQLRNPNEKWSLFSFESYLGLKLSGFEEERHKYPCAHPPDAPVKNTTLASRANHADVKNTFKCVLGPNCQQGSTSNIFLSLSVFSAEEKVHTQHPKHCMSVTS